MCNLCFWRVAKCWLVMVAAQWIRLRLPSCGTVFESQAQHMRFLGKFCTLYVIVLRKGRKWVYPSFFKKTLVYFKIQNWIIPNWEPLQLFSWSPMWHLGKKIKVLGNFWGFSVFVSILTLLWQKCSTIWANFHCCKWPNIFKLTIEVFHQKTLTILF